MTLLMILLLVFLITSIGGGVTYKRFGPAGLSPAAILLIIVVVLYFTGSLR